MSNLTPDEGNPRNHDIQPDKNSPVGIFDLLTEALQRSGEGQDVSIERGEGSDGVETAFIKKRPSGDATLYVDEAGGFVVDWKEKFLRVQQQHYPPFSAGELIRAQGFVRKNSQSGDYAFHVDADESIADTFHLGRADALASYHGLPVTLVIKVGEERKANGKISESWNYDATFVEIDSRPLVNPSPEQVAALSSGTRVIVEGTFIGFCGKPENEWYGTYDSGKVRTDEGREIYIDFPTGQINYSEGAHENLHGKVPSEGDRVAIGAFVTRSRREPSPTAEGIDVGVRLAAYWCDPCVLRDPSETRKTSYDNLRETINDNIAHIRGEIGNRNWPGARSLIGCTRKMELSGTELDRIDALLINIPEQERPVLVPRDLYQGTNAPHFWADSIDTAYGINLESMSKLEFIEFMRSAVTGERPQTGKRADTSYLFLIAEEFGVEAVTTEKLLTECLDQRLLRLRSVPHGLDVHLDDRPNIEQAFKYLARVGTPSSIQKILDLLCDFVEKGEFHKHGWRDMDRRNLPETFVYGAASAIACNLGRISLDILQDNLKQLVAIRTKLDQEGDEAHSLREIDTIVSFATEF